MYIVYIVQEFCFPLHSIPGLYRPIVTSNNNPLRPNNKTIISAISTVKGNL